MCIVSNSSLWSGFLDLDYVLELMNLGSMVVRKRLPPLRITASDAMFAKKMKVC